MLFLLAGIVPGTNIVLAPTTTLAVLAASICILPLFHRRGYIVTFSYKLYDTLSSQSKKTRKRSLPLRRYSQI